MKKIKLSVAALLIAGMSYGQTNDSITIDKFQVYDMMATLDDMLDWFGEDENNGDFSHGSYEEGWGHAYWITEMRNELEELISKNEDK